MAKAAKPEHVLAHQQTADQDFSWLDADDVVLTPITPKKKKRAAKSGTTAYHTPDPNSGRQKVLRRKDEIDQRKRREGVGNRESDHRRTMTENKWKKFLELTANGLKRMDIFRVLTMTKETFDAHMITSVAAAKQLREADSIWLRREFSLDDIEQMLTKLSLGRTREKAGNELGWDENKQARFIRLARCDARIRDMYDLAREFQSEGWMDENIDIADAPGMFIDAKGIERTDTGAVQKARLRIEARQWTMGAMNRKRFGDHKFIDHSGEIQVNHAVQLSNARKRLEKAHKKPPATIDNETQQVVNE